MKKDIQFIFFDFDGTIADTEEIHFRAFKKTLEKYGVSITWQEYIEKYLAYTDEDFFRVISNERNLNFDIKSMRLDKEGNFQEFIQNIKLFPGIEETLRYLKQKNYKFSIVSGALRKEIESILKKYGLLELFEFIVAADDYDEGKPSSKPFEVAIERAKNMGYNLINELCVSFEDSPYGIIAAKKLGLFTVGISNYYPKEKLIEAGADIVINSFLNPQDIEEKIKSSLESRIVEGERVLLVSQKRNKTFLISANKKDSLHTHLGVVRCADIVGNYYGKKVHSSKGEAFFILQPTLEDKIKKIERKSAVIYPKDSSFMIFISGISSGSKVIESGCGSGGLTLSLAHFVKPTGRIFIYEIRDDFMEITQKNLKQYGLLDYVTFKKKDVYKEGFDEKNVDAVFLDLPEPWHCVKFAWESLKPSGILLSISPTVNQTEIMCEVMRSNGFILVDTFEILLRRFLAREGKSRPYENMIGHTAYISVGRKVEK